jgi:hypothetical protein
MATINHKTYNEATETFKDFSVYDGKETLIFKVDGADQTVYASNIIGSGIIKTSDNGPLSATAKYLSDGLGNNSALALSTSLVGVGATTLFTKMSIANSLSATSIGTNYNAGILNIQNTNTTNGNLSLIGFQDASASINLAAVGAINTVHSASPNSVVGELGFYTKASGGGYVTERLRITSTGNVGIGTSAPTEKLDVIGGALAAGNGTIRTGITYSSLGLLGTFTNHDLGLITNGTEKARITAAGNVGIGTSAPQQKLSVSSTGVTRVLVENTDNQATGAGIQMLVSNAGTAVSNGTIRMDNADNMSFFNVGGERVTITSAGNVGIGTSSPSGKLHVAGGDIFLGASYALKYNSTSYITPENNVSGAEVSTGGVFVVKTGVSPAERLRVDASGNVGIGTSSPKNVLDLGAASLGRGLTFDNFSNIFSSYSAGDLVLSSNFYGSTASDSYLTSTTATFGAAGVRISGTQGGATSGQIQFFANEAAAKTAGAAFTPTERMRITGAGNVGIGTTSPAAYSGYAALGINGTNGGVIDLMVGGVRRGSIYNTSSGNTLAIDSITGTNIGFFVNGGERAAVTVNGLTFNGDTAAANALDDYEEGTWTMGLSFSGASVGVTYNNNTGTYTKIGRQVTVNGYMYLSSKGSSTGSARLTGLPFLIPNTLANYSTSALWLANTSFANQYQGVGAINTTTVDLQETTEAGVISPLNDANFANNSEVIISFTYFV